MIFAISMDYTVFLLSSAKEHWDKNHDAKEAMVGGLAHSAQRSSIKKQAAQHDRVVRKRHETASWCLAIAVLRIGH